MMKNLLLLVIKLYWAIVPKNKRRRCIFKISCSQYVYHKTKNEGLIKGIAAIRYRFNNCRSGFHIYEDPIDKCKTMILPNLQMIKENEISERFLNG
ncbi:membrane protein insertion efficiency factor YidD [Pedobacter sp.]|uniref:membrane protein insertion efficiency factor YidD n=2 Tax=Pedobacter sp. TaxID=1411316 RepID=UPI003BACC696